MAVFLLAIFFAYFETDGRFTVSLRLHFLLVLVSVTLLVNKTVCVKDKVDNWKGKKKCIQGQRWMS